MADLDGLPPVLNLSLYAGDDYRIPLTITRGGVPVDVTGTALVQMRVDATSDVVMMTMGIEVTNASQGKADLLVDGAVTEALIDTDPAVMVVEGRTPEGVLYREATLTGVWDWQNTNGAADTTFCGGSLTLTADVSRP